MNTYATLDQLKNKLNITGTTQDDELMLALDAGSRAAEYYAGRKFWTFDSTLNFKPSGAYDDLLTSDLLVADAVTVDDEALTVTTDYYLHPLNRLPYTKIIKESGRWSGDVAVTGTWGAGNMVDTSPWEATAITVTLADGTGTSATLSAAGTLEAGQTILVEDEQIYIDRIVTTTATVKRGVNLTTGAAHDAKVASIALYPTDVINGALWLAVAAYNEFSGVGLESETIGNYSYKRMNQMLSEKQRGNMFGRVMRGVADY